MTPATATRNELEGVLANEVLDARLQGFGAAGVGADDEDCVLAGYGADDVGPFFVVERGGDGLRTAHGGKDNEEVLGLRGP